MRRTETITHEQRPSPDTLGLYVSVPFCRSKCSFCNFASGVYPESRLAAYVARLVDDLEGARGAAAAAGLVLPELVDSIYFGGGTPSLLGPALVAELFAAVRRHFHVAADAEITLETAPGQISDETLAAALASGVNRFSFGVQSFVDAEARAVGRLHTSAIALADIERTVAAGARASVDLIAGLPGQTMVSWRDSVAMLIDSGVGHASIYMFEVDEDSRLGREMVLGGVRYGAAAVPSEEATADMYLEACERLGAAGLVQYEISNFARPGSESRHNLKYWQRDAYLGLGVDASSMLRDAQGGAVRFGTGDALEPYLAGPAAPELDRLHRDREMEEAWFLGLRTSAGVSLAAFDDEFGCAADYRPLVEQLAGDGLLIQEGDRIRLTMRGRLVSNDVFERFLTPEPLFAL
jgi:oxygen-independent coproporphyrinogen-3 oxidase